MTLEEVLEAMLRDQASTAFYGYLLESFLFALASLLFAYLLMRLWQSKRKFYLLDKAFCLFLLLSLTMTGIFGGATALVGVHTKREQTKPEILQARIGTIKEHLTGGTTLAVPCQARKLSGASDDKQVEIVCPALTWTPDIFKLRTDAQTYQVWQQVEKGLPTTEQ